MKIYIAGKITGDKNYKTKFFQAALPLLEAGHTVLLPSMLPSSGLTEADYMRICLAMIDTADLVLFLPDYIESQGAMVEWSLCQKTDKPHENYTDWAEANIP